HAAALRYRTGAGPAALQRVDVKRGRTETWQSPRSASDLPDTCSCYLGTIEVIQQLLDSWTSIYSNHAALKTGIAFMHIGGLVAGGGGAITADLATIAAARTRSSRLMAQLDLLKKTHVVVILGLIALVVSGVLLFAADVDTFISSRIFWLKMGLMV